jgi:methyl-accepting chemotaxis protein
MIDIGVDSIQEKISSIKSYKGSVCAVFTNAGLVGGHFDASRVGKPMRETERDTAGSYLDELIDAVHAGKEFSFVNFVHRLDAEMYFVCVPISIARTDTPWMLMIGIPVQAINAPVIRMLTICVPVVAVMIVIIVLCAIHIARGISKPLGIMTKAFDAMGDGDLTKILAVKSKDEIGDIGRSFNQTVDKIKHLIFAIKQQAVNLYDMSVELASSMNQTASAITRITENIKDIKTRIINQSAGVVETNATMEQIIGNIDKLNRIIEEQNASVEQSSSAIEQMLANINSVTQTLVKNARNVAELSRASEIGRMGLVRVAGDIKEIAQESEGLLEINTLMENIASQTNLLSMNASIEAAHAGDAGSGFGVVADEIRKLAESSSEQSKTVGAVLKKIKESIDKITASTNNVLAEFEAIDSCVKIVADQEGHIRNAMEEQGEGSKQILEAIAKLADITHQVKDGARNMLAGSAEVIRGSKSLDSVTQEITRGMNEMAGSADQINDAVNYVNSISGKNKENLDVLVSEVSKFRVA